jgi:hypothetical protein
MPTKQPQFRVMLEMGIKNFVIASTHTQVPCLNTAHCVDGGNMLSWMIHSIKRNLNPQEDRPPPDDVVSETTYYTVLLHRRLQLAQRAFVHLRYLKKDCNSPGIIASSLI